MIIGPLLKFHDERDILRLTDTRDSREEIPNMSSNHHISPDS
jgi:hypothetical protein